jgi:hypothetical protein
MTKTKACAHSADFEATPTGAANTASSHQHPRRQKRPTSLILTPSKAPFSAVRTRHEHLIEAFPASTPR